MLNSLLSWRGVLVQLIFPPGIIIIAILLFYILLVYKKKKIATFFMLFLVSFLLLFSSWMGEYLFLRPLEERYMVNKGIFKERMNFSNPVIVVLSGDSIIRGSLTEEVNTEVGEITLARLIGAYFLYKDIGCPIIVSGGIIPGVGDNISAASAMKELLVRLGVPEENILTEGRSTTTLENAIFTMDLIEKYNYQEAILVTSAVHMPRAILAFKNRGVAISPVPVNFLYKNIQPDILDILPNRSSWEHNLRALHEWVGLFYYRIINR